MQDLRLTYEQVLVYLAIWNAVLGILFGVFPLLVGLRLKNRKYGVFGFAGSFIGGAIAGVVIAFPVAVIFTWLMLRNPTPATADAAPEVPIAGGPEGQ